MRWHIPDFDSEWLICDSESSGSLGEYYNECNGSSLYCDDSQANNYGSIGSCETTVNVTTETATENNTANVNNTKTAVCNDSQAFNYGSAGSCDTDINISNVFGDAINFDDNTYTLNSDFTIDSTNSSYFPIPIEDGMTFDGNNKTITYDDTNEWTGLFSPVSGTGSEQSTTFKIQNINFLLNTKIKKYYGAIVSYYYTSSNVTPTFEYCNIDIYNCHLSGSGTISNTDSGGIVGYGFSYNSNSSIKYCSNTLDISGRYSGGICGIYAGKKSEGLLIEYCWNEGVISGMGSGGICGAYAGHNSSNVKINYCYNTGVISGSRAGGICGSYAGGTEGTVSIFNCYHTGNISETDAGGIWLL